MRQIGSIWAAVTCVLAAGSAIADDDFTRKGNYLIVGGTYAISQVGTDDFGAFINLGPNPPVLSTTNSGGLTLRGGTRFNKWLAFELQYEW